MLARSPSELDCMDADKLTMAKTEADAKCLTELEVHGKNLTDIIFPDVVDCSQCELLDCFETLLINRPDKRYCLDYCEPQENTCSSMKENFECSQCDSREKCISTEEICWWMGVSESTCHPECSAAINAPHCSKCTPDSFANGDEFCNANCGTERTGFCSNFCSTEDRKNCDHAFCKDHCDRGYCGWDDSFSGS